MKKSGPLRYVWMCVYIHVHLLLHWCVDFVHKCKGNNISLELQVESLVCLTTYTHEQILVMEKTILYKLEWTLTVPTPLVFLVRFIKATVPDQEVSSKLLNYDSFLLNFCLVWISFSISAFIVGKLGSFSVWVGIGALCHRKVLSINGCSLSSVCS